MSILGSLIVELKASTASFIDGMNAAAKTSRTVGRDIEGAFSGIGEVAGAALAPFGELGIAISATFDQVGAAASSAIQTLGKMGGTFGVALGGVAAVGAGATAALLSVEAAAIGLAIHASENAAKLGELALKTGVSTQALAGLGSAGASVGVDMETMAKALELMNASAVKAAIAPASTQTAYSRLGIEVKDTSGKMKDSGALFLEVAAKLATIPQPEEGYFAKQIFGKGGIAIIPVIELGAKRLQEITEEAKAAGLGDPATVAISQKFKETMEDISTQVQGVALRLTKDLLPALTFVSEYVGEAFKAGTAQTFIDKLSEITKYTFAAGAAAVEMFRDWIAGGSLIQTISAKIIEAMALIGEAMSKPWAIFESEYKSRVANLNFGGAIKNAVGAFSAETAKAAANTDELVAGIFSAKAEAPSGKQTKTGTAALGTKDPALEAIKDRIKLLDEETAKWLTLSTAGTRAEQLIAEATSKGKEEFQKLIEQASKDKVNPAGALAEVMQNESLIKGAEAAGVYGAAIKALTANLDDQGSKFQEETKAAGAMAIAYQQGAAAIAAAALGKQFASDNAQLDVFIKLQQLLAAGKTPNQMLGPLAPAADAQNYKIVADAVAATSKKLASDEAGAGAKAVGELTEQLNAQTWSLGTLKPYVSAVGDAYFEGADAVRAARVELALYEWQQQQIAKGVTPATTIVSIKNPATGHTETMTALEAERKALQEKDSEAYAEAIAQQAAQYDLNAIYKTQITTLQDVKRAIEEKGASTLLIDSKIFDAQNALIHLWDEDAIKVGTFGQKFQGVMNELALQGRQAGEAIVKAFQTAIDGIETQFARLVTGQKTNFKQVFDNLAESYAKAQIQRTVGSIAEHFGVKVTGGKPDGSQNNPLYVVLHGGGLTGLAGLAGGGGADSGSGSGKKSWFGKIIGSIFGGGLSGVGSAASIGANPPDGTIGNPFYTLDAAAATGTGLGSGSGSFGGGLGSLFGLGGSGEGGGGGGIGSLLSSFISFIPGLAGGGDVSPGKLYRVNERNEEYFIPHVAGRISPANAGSGRSGPTINQHVTFNLSQKPDLFKKSDAQIDAHMYRQMSIAHSRSR